MFYLNFKEKGLSITSTQKPNSSMLITYQQCAVFQLQGPLEPSKRTFHALIGLKKIKNNFLLIVATQVQKITSIDFSSIYEVKKVQWIPLAPQNVQQLILKELQQQINNLSYVFQHGFHYYSDDGYDLTLPLTYNKYNKPSVQVKAYYQQFIWNNNLIRMDGIKSQGQIAMFSKYCSKLVQGYIQQFQNILPCKSKLRYIIISRRSMKKAGTRFYARGIDDDGYVANFVQTQQIAYVGDLLFTHLQIRGSVPVFFSQLGVNGIASQMVIQRKAALTRTAFNKHFETLSKIYGRILCVNLLSDKKSEEKQLTLFYQNMMEDQSKNIPYARYHYYDFHEECKGDKFEKSQLLVDKFDQIIKLFGYTAYYKSTGKLIRQQTGVFRTNCLDCLDRTNYVQSRIALRIFKKLFNFCSLQTLQLVQNGNLLQKPGNKDYPILSSFNALWADNGDAISLLYTDIGSTHTDITRTGERTFSGAINHKFRSLMRFYTQFTDLKKHSAIQQLTTPSNHKHLQINLNDYHRITVFSYNLQQDKQSAQKSIKQQLIKRQASIFVCFVFVNKSVPFLDKVSNLFRKQKDHFKQWQRIVKSQAKDLKFNEVGSLQGKSCWIGVFCEQISSDKLTNVKQQNLTQISKGEALLIKLSLYNSSLIFAGVNFDSFDDYLSSFDELHEKGFQTSKLGIFKSSSFSQQDYRVIFGNTASKIVLPQQDIQRLLNEYDYCQTKYDKAGANRIAQRLLSCDQLKKDANRLSTKCLKMYNEGNLQGLPSGNRLIFWKRQSSHINVQQYKSIGKTGLLSILNYKISKGLSQSRKV